MVADEGVSEDEELMIATIATLSGSPALTMASYLALN